MSSRNSSVPRKPKTQATIKVQESPKKSGKKLATDPKTYGNSAGMTAGTKPNEYEIFVAYSQIWALAPLLMSWYYSKGDILSLPWDKQVNLIFCLASFSGSVPLVLGAHLWSLFIFVKSSDPTAGRPWASDCQHWKSHLDLSFVLVTLNAAFSKFKKCGKYNVFEKLSPDEYKSIIDGIAALMRVQFIIWYSGATIWKMNRGFVDPAGNCSALYLFQILAAYLPESLTFDWLLQLVAWVAPHLTLLVEGGVSVLFSFPGFLTRCGVALGLLLHFMIAITPPPNNIAPYGIALAARYTFFSPEATAHALVEVKTIAGSICAKILKVMLGSESTTTQASKMPSALSVGALMGAAFAVIAAAEISTVWEVGGMLIAVDPDAIQKKERDWTISIYTIFVLLFSRAIYLASTTYASCSERGADWKRGKLWWFIVVEGLFFVYGLSILGLVDNGPPKPFSNIRMHGGSNHWFLPTTLIQQYIGDSSYFAGGALSSEVIRVDKSTSSYVNGLHPAEITKMVEPRALELLKRVGHNGRIFSPAIGRWYWSGKLRNDPGPDFIRFTLPVFEFRRLLDEARQQNEAFTIEYTRLPRYDASKQTAPGVRVRIQEDGKGGKVCTLLDTGKPCGVDELPFLPPIGFWESYKGGFWPSPILPEQAEQHSGFCMSE